MAGTRPTAGATDAAIVGMACLFAGADGKDAFWHNIVNKVEAIGEPPEGWGAERHYDPNGGGRLSTTAGGFLRDLFRFDPMELGVMPSSIDAGEPDQFLALRIAREALRDSGYLRDDYDHTNTGVILGHTSFVHRGNVNVIQHGVFVDQTVELVAQLFPDMGDEALARLKSALTDKLPPLNSDTMPGLVPNVMTGRIANKLNLRGPNYIIDAACASSLVAVDTALEELASGRSDLMLAGGVNASIPAEVQIGFTLLDALSHDGRVRPFSSSASGTLMGEGLGIVVLKRVEDAMRDGDRIYAVIKAVGQSSDGKGVGVLAPRLEGEALALRRAYRRADIDPASVTLIEAHGTGIPLGDRTEIGALTEIFGERRGDSPTIAIGSIKSMIGHCIPAAGIAGLIKTALALHDKVLPPTLCDEVSGELGIEATPFYVNTAARPWVRPMGVPRRAGVNAFGFGGVNSHAILEEYEPENGEVRRARTWPSELIVLAGETRDALAAKVANLELRLGDGRPAGLTLAEAAAACARSAAGGEARLALVADSLDDLSAKLARARQRLAEPGARQLKARSGMFFAEHRVGGSLAFVFPGEGGQYQGMLADVLMCFPEARRWFDFWDGIHGARRGFLPSECVFPPPTVLDETVAAARRERLFDIELGSESTWIASQALLAVAEAVGLRPDAVVGHSNGEHSAMLASGAMRARSWRDLKRHIRKLNSQYHEIAAAGKTVNGVLMSVGGVARERVLELVDGKRVHLALDNCRHQTVLYGTPEAMEDVAAVLRRESGLCALLPIDRPYHTPLFAPVAAAIEDLYRDIRFGTPAIPIYSCATAAPMPEEPDEIRRLAAHQWCARVRFTETIARMYADGVRTFVEVGPSSSLTGFIGDILPQADVLAVSLDSQRRSSLAQLLGALGQLWVSGREVGVAELFEGRGIAAHDLNVEQPAPERRDRPFPNTPPYIKLADGEVDELRALMRPVPASDAPAIEAYADAAEPAPDQVLVEHFAVMRDFLAGQQSVLEAALAGDGDPAAADGFPFIHRVTESGRDRVVAECDLSFAHHEFLRHHTFYTPNVSDADPNLHGLPVAPIAVSVEMVAETAAMLTEKPRLDRLENIRAHSWVALDEGAVTLVLSAERLGSEGGEERFAAAIADCNGPLFEAEVVFVDDDGGDAPMRALPELRAPRMPAWRDAQLYTTGMFHGPMFHSVRHLIAWDETGLDADIHDTPIDGFIEPGRRPALLLNPVLLEVLGHVTAFWIAEQLGTDFSCFPIRIERFELPAAAEEATAGCILRGRMSFDIAADGTPRELLGSYECTTPDGYVLFRALGWRDRFFKVPHRFFLARWKPRECWYGEDCTDRFAEVPEGALVWFVPAFPPGFFEDAGAIWWRVLAHTVLSAEERRHLSDLPRTPRRRVDWLLGRVAIKEVARRWIELDQGVRLMPADVIVRVDAKGKPYVLVEGIAGIARLPEVSVAHTGGHAVAIAAPPGTPVGIDAETGSRVAPQDIAEGAFDAQERALIGNGAGAEFGARVLRAWCAKEAAAKCLGEGFNGRPKTFSVSRFCADDGSGETLVNGLGHEFRVSFALRDDAVLAVAFT